MKRSPLVDNDFLSQSLSISHCDSPPVVATPTVSAFDIVLMDSRLASLFTLSLSSFPCLSLHSTSFFLLIIFNKVKIFLLLTILMCLILMPLLVLLSVLLLLFYISTERTLLFYVFSDF